MAEGLRLAGHALWIVGLMLLLATVGMGEWAKATPTAHRIRLLSAYLLGGVLFVVGRLVVTPSLPIRLGWLVLLLLLGVEGWRLARRGRADG